MNLFCFTLVGSSDLLVWFVYELTALGFAAVIERRVDVMTLFMVKLYVGGK